NGGFGTHYEFAAGIHPVAVVLGDLNGDHKIDLAVANNGFSGSGCTVSVLLGDGAGDFGSAGEYAVGSGPQSIAIADLIGDTKPDVVTANYGSSTVSVLYGDGSGGLGGRTDFATGSGPTSVAIGDLNGDGTYDLAVSNSGSATVSALLGNGSGGFAAKTDF